MQVTGSARPISRRAITSIVVHRSLHPSLQHTKYSAQWWMVITSKFVAIMVRIRSCLITLTENIPMLESREKRLLQDRIVRLLGLPNQVQIIRLLEVIFRHPIARHSHLPQEKRTTEGRNATNDNSSGSASSGGNAKQSRPKGSKPKAPCQPERAAAPTVRGTMPNAAKASQAKAPSRTLPRDPVAVTTSAEQKPLSVADRNTGALFMAT